jgi:3-phosphoshikimate 1-carboxyvinyltransferase
MERIAGPLAQMGAVVETTDGTPPLTIEGGELHGIRYELPVASAQVKSCVLLAGLYAQGRTTVVEPLPTRDHTELMLQAGGVLVRRQQRRISGPAERLGSERSSCRAISPRRRRSSSRRRCCRAPS